MPNKLATEGSPYLLQHADNPVDWYPWGAEALARAKAEDKPILLSIGYAACHWCHVMAHESFEDEETAALMNRLFVNVKVDREERPDLDGIYMDACVALTGRGGWPMTVVLTPDGKPFFGGTYFPREPRHGVPGFKQVLEAVADVWSKRRSDVLESADRLTEQMTRSLAFSERPGSLSTVTLANAVEAIGAQFEPRNGGFGRAPKFPQAMTIEFLLRHALGTGDSHALHMATHTLTKMADGGIYDHLGGGFARYSTDDRWLVPHFEKMLYDNALLARAYLHAWQLTRDRQYRSVVEASLAWALREMRHPRGGFCSSLDADSEGVEGRYYLWDKAEISALVGVHADAFERVYGVSVDGNWEGRNVLHVARAVDEVAADMGIAQAELEDRMSEARRALLAARDGRVRPALDDKVITSWNGMMLAALADAGRVLGRDDFVRAAVANAGFLRSELRDPSGRLKRTWTSAGGARLNAYLSDYADLIEGLIALYRATWDARWMAWARELADVMLARFTDPDGIGFFDTPDDHEDLVLRPRDVHDNAVPSGNAMAATVLLKLSAYTGDGAQWERGAMAISAVSGLMDRAPTAFSQWLQAGWMMLAKPRELAIVGDPTATDTKALLAVVDAVWRPELAVAVGGSDEAERVPLLAGRSKVDGRATAYLCRGLACQAPTTEPADLARQLDRTLS